jgi:hypothetical protein
MTEVWDVVGVACFRVTLDAFHCSIDELEDKLPPIG